MKAIGPAGLYHGVVAHRRHRPVEHKLAYKVFSMLIDVDRLDETSARLKLFSRNKFNLYSFHDADHGHGGPSDLAAHVRATLSDAGLDGSGRMLLLCYPRILGYAFNPLSIYYCHDGAGRLSAVLYEVRNTFGGRHSYLIPVDGAPEIIRQEADKLLHVSPFMAMNMRYHFRLTRPAEALAVSIRETDGDGLMLTAAFSGARVDMTDGALLRAFLRYPLMTVKVIVAIHVEAARLFAKGLRLRGKPADPAAPVTLVSETAARKAA